jgi:hypothetical protein
MSYLGRITARMDGRPARQLLPAGPVSSPLARYDQRLNLLGGGGGGGASEPRLSQDSGPSSDPFVDHEVPDGGAPAHGREMSSHAGAVAMDTSLPPHPGIERSTPASSAVQGDRSAADGFNDNTSPQGEAAPPRPDGAMPVPRPISLESHLPGLGIAHAAASEPPAAPELPLLPEHQQGRPRQNGGYSLDARASHRATSESPMHDRNDGAAETTSSGRGQAKALAEKPSTGNPSADALTNTLDRISRWIASPQKTAGPAHRQAAASAAAASEASLRAGTPATLRPRVGSPWQTGSKPLHDSSPRTRFSLEPAAPRLSVGRIDVQVVTPAPPPVRPAAGPPRGMFAARASTSMSSYLTFGLRQR